MTEENVPLPTAAGLTFRAITEADIDEWLALVKRIAAVEKPPWHEQRSDLEDVFSSVKNDPVVNTVFGLDDGGTPRAWGRVTKNKDGAKAHAMGGVDPQFQRRGVGTAVLRWSAAQARRRFVQDGTPDPLVRVYDEEDNAASAALYAAAGFSVVRYFTEMIRPLDTVLPPVVLPDGLRIVPFSPEVSESMRQAHNEAFADHWGSEPRDEEAWGFVVNHEQGRPDWSAAVVDDATGEVAGYQWSSYDPAVLADEGRNEGYTELLGVRRHWRGQGLAQALLADAMAKFKASGMDHASLDVDTENPSGALGIYQRMGYQPTRRSMAWDKRL
ncbi:GNAT family N-acetyltransferase [Arthrobacter sp. 35W]|uniref:GNAT family N-acetyltransferase n=1 Tax=Arthrobacter sp. 35W TaxID=1132441 RepID=UPI0005506056|nr:GNAT family N-acetyltransferase [Arthrobacter sp. 35W]